MKNKRIFTALISAVLSLSITFPLSGCSDKQLSVNDVNFYSVYNTYKVKRDEMPADREILPADQLEITMVQGEYEILQLIMNPKKDVNYYNATISDLVNVNNSNIIYKKENVVIAKQEYMYIGSIGSKSTSWPGYTPGYYPDALIPLHAVVSFGENTIKANENQGLTFQFSTRPELINDDPVLKDGITEEQAKTMTDQEKYNYNPSGTYVGNITLDFKTFTKVIPVTLNISSATVSETVHTKSDFGQRTYKYNAELNYTQEATDMWNSTIVKYRHMSARVHTEQSGSKLDKLTKLGIARKLLRRERVNNWAFTSNEDVFSKTFKEDTAWHEENAKLEGVKSLLAEPTMQYFDYWVKASIEDNYNYIRKLCIKVNCVDEPASHNRWPCVEATGKVFDKMMATYTNLLENDSFYSTELTDGETLASLWAGYEGDKASFKAELIASLDDIIIPVSEQYSSTYAPYVDCWVPSIPHYATSVQRANYANDKERWWFAFVHDVEGNLLPERAMGWMAAEYDVVGQMEWAIDCFYDSTNGSKMIDDFFTTNYLRSNYGNGDGWYLYPGGQYELDEVIPSFRMQARVDAFEEWELFYNLKQIYAQIAEDTGMEVDATGVISGLGSNIYNGTTAIQHCGNFEMTRRALINLAKCTESEARFCIANVKENGYGKVIYTIYLRANADGSYRELKNHGVSVQPKERVGTGENVGYVYEVTIDRTLGSDNSVALSFKADGEDMLYTQGVGGKMTIIEAEEIGASSFKTATTDVFAQYVDTVGTSVDLEGLEIGTKDIEITFYGKDAEEYGQSYVNIFVQSAKLNSLFSSKVGQMVVHFHNPTNKVIKISATGQIQNQVVWASLFTAELQPGYNSVVLNARGNDWEKNPLLKMKWNFMNQDGTPMFSNETIYLKDIVVYEV